MSYSRSPISRTPLLSSAQDPGMSQRLSESSIASIANGNSQSHGMSRSGYSSVANPRAQYGPSAKLGTPSSSSQGLSTSDSSRTALGDVSSTNKLAGAGAFGMMDDDDDMDDHIHNFSAAEKRNPNAMTPFDITSARGWANALTLVFLMLALVGIFALYPILSFYTNDRNSVGANASGFNLGGVNSTGQYPDIPGLPRMIDADTPDSVKSRTGFDGEEWVLVFSDEFNQEGRTFYPGDDPFWTAVDIHYWGTNDFEWLDPSAVTTKDGHLLITMTQEPIHDLNLKSGMIQSWNQLCFNTNAYIEVSASLPGTSGVGGFWPGIWTMGNLGRPGYGATNDGTWPYTYDSCDVGTLPNQTYPDGSGPLAALNTGSDGGSLSFLPGQRLSACTCPGEDHPGPDVSKGRGAPEIDMVEAQIRISVQHGEVSQSNQIAPYDDYYQFVNTTTGSRPAVVVYDEDLTMWNTYKGGLYQQTVSGLTLLPDRIYYNQVVGGRSKEFAVFGFEYSAYPEDRDRGYIHWITDNKPAWTQYAHATPANPRTEIGPRIIAEEPMALIFNLHASNNFQNVDWAHMDFPNYMRVDYVRVYQRNDGSGTVGCDPPEYPTKDYIERHANAYNNPNLTTWDMTGNSMPKNRLSSTC